MGYWNTTCAISNLHIKGGEDVVVMLLGENQPKKTFCYTNALYDICPLPFYGQYDDYGGVENCHGVALPHVLKAMKQNVYETRNKLVKVSRSRFNIDKLFEADHEEILGIEEKQDFSEELLKLEKLQKKILKGKATQQDMQQLEALQFMVNGRGAFRRVTHITIHQQICENILNDYWQPSYPQGNIRYKDMVADLPQYIEYIKKSYAQHHHIGLSLDEVKEQIPQNIAMIYLHHAFLSSEKTFLVNAQQLLQDMLNAQFSNKKIHQLLTEVSKVIWLDHFMSSTRRVWTKPSGLGSQSEDWVGHTVLAQSILAIASNP